VQWDHQASATPNAQLAFFAEFLCATGVYETWVKSCPLTYTSPNAPTKQDVLGTWLLAILAGHNRYAHINALRANAVSPQILGMKKIISEDALRRARRTDGGHHEPCVAARGRGAGGQAWETDDVVSHADARGQGQGVGPHRQCACSTESRQSCCGAVAWR